MLLAMARLLSDGFRRVSCDWLNYDRNRSMMQYIDHWPQLNGIHLDMLVVIGLITIVIDQW